MMKLFVLAAISVLIAISSTDLLGIELSTAVNKDVDREYYLKVKSKTGNRVNWFINSETFDGYFTLNRAATLIGFYSSEGEMKTINGSSGWPLTPWPQSTRMLGEGTNWKARPLIAGAIGGETTAVSNPKLMTLDQIENYDLPAFKEFIGCLSNAPLRYGDIDTNGASELVLILDQDLVVFSPAQEKVIFATRFANADELQAHEVDA